MDTNNGEETPNRRWDCKLPDCGNAGARAGTAQQAKEADDAQWKQKFYNKVQERGLNLQRSKMEALQRAKAEEEKRLKNEPPDPLAREWFSTDKETVDVRAYMLDKLLPTLVPGVEKLLMEAEKRRQLDPEETNVPKFNPINFLAETLMRNNPQIISFPKTSSYTRGLKEVLKDLKSQVADMEFNRLAQLKQEMKEIQEQLVQQKETSVREKDERKEALALQFREWTPDVTGRVPAALIQSALKSFQEIASRSLVQPKLDLGQMTYAEGLQSKMASYNVYQKWSKAYFHEYPVTVSYAKDLDETLEHKLNVEEFVEYVYSYAKDLSPDLFEELLQHLTLSADVFRQTIRHDRWRQMFIDLFLACDHGKVGLLDRRRVLLLLEAFYDSTGPEDAAWGFRNPRQWPVIEFREMDPRDFWADFDEAPSVSEQDDSAILHPSASALRVSPSHTTTGLLTDETTKVSEPEEYVLPHASSSDLQLYPSNTFSEIWYDGHNAPKAPEQERSHAPHSVDSMVAPQGGGELEVSVERQIFERLQSIYSSEVLPTLLAERQGRVSIVAQESRQQVDVARKRQSSDVVRRVHSLEIGPKVSAEGQGGVSTSARQSIQEETAVKRQSSEVVRGVHSLEIEPKVSAKGQGGVSTSARQSLQEETAVKRKSSEVVRGVHSLEIGPKVSAKGQGGVSTSARQSLQEDTAVKSQSSEVVRGVHSLEIEPKGSAEGQGGVSTSARQSLQEDTAVKRQSAENAGSVETSDVVPAVPSEEHSSKLLLQENTNVNAGNDELVADPTEENTSGTPPPASQEPSTHEQNAVPERRYSSPKQSRSVLTGTQPRLEEPTAVQSSMSISAEKDAEVRESETEGPSTGQDMGVIEVTEGNQQEELSLGLTPEERDAEEQTAGDVDVANESQYIDGVPWSGDLLTSNLTLKYGPYGSQSQDEWSAAASRFADLRPIINDLHSWAPPRVTSAFDRNSLNLPQFVQLMETFLGGETSQASVERLVDYMRTGYVETEEEKSQRLEKAQREAFSARCKVVLDALFKKLDNEGSGFLDLSALEATLSKYKGGIDAELLSKGRARLKSPYPCKGDSMRINSRDFQRLMEFLLAELPGTEEEVFEKLVKFLTTRVERTQLEHMRGAARRKWLHEIRRVAESSGGNLEPVYQAAFQALLKDAESHGNKKKISASIGLLEQSLPDEESSCILLRYVACTPDDAPYILDKALYRDMKGVSFDAIDGGKPVHVPRVQYHGNIHFWKHDRPVEERTGSFIVIPLRDANFQIFGTLGIDTVRDARERSIFVLHEISFYEGVANTFSDAYHYVLIRRNILLLVSSALAWIHNRAPHIQSVTTYLMEPGTEKEPDYVLRKAMTTDNNTGLSETYLKPATLRRKENLFRDYLFRCADSSEVITTDAYGERHIAVPIREPSGRALAVVDICTGQRRQLPAHEFQDLQKMLQMLQEACNEILEESEGEKERTFILATLRIYMVLNFLFTEAERTGEESRLGVLFYRFMLQDLRECVRKLDNPSFAELKSYKDPPVMIHNILRAVLLLFNPEWAGSEEVESWNQCKLKVNSDLVHRIYSFDPTASTVRVHPMIVAKYIKGIPRGAVWRHGSVPAEYLYNWAFTCLSLLELNPNPPETPKTSVASSVPSQVPSLLPSQMPSLVPSQMPSLVPSQMPSLVPSQMPSLVPSQMPSLVPSKMPSLVPSQMPSLVPSQMPTLVPNQMPSLVPSKMPSLVPSKMPSLVPSKMPSLVPSQMPSLVPSQMPSLVPSQMPSLVPSQMPSLVPSQMPTLVPSQQMPSQVPNSMSSTDTQPVA